jgi:hypothetical protein
MEDRTKIDLQQHIPKRVSRKHIFKILFYIALLTAAAIVYANMETKKEVVKQPEVEEIRNFTIEQ